MPRTKTGSIDTEIEASIEFTYTSGARAITDGPADNWDPGYGPEILDFDLYIDGQSITKHLDDETKAKIEQLIIEHIIDERD